MTPSQYVVYIYVLFSGVKLLCTFTFYLDTSHLLCFSAEAYSEPSQVSKAERFACLFNDFKSLTVFSLTLHLRCLKRSWICLNSDCTWHVLCHHNKHLMKYFKFLYDLGIIWIPLNIPEKLRWQHLFKMPEEAETHRLYLS